MLDEQTLGKLLEAAYVLQEHNREVRELELGLDLKRDQMEAEQKANSDPVAEASHTHPAEPAPPGDYTFTLAQIVATQHQIQLRNLRLQETMALVTERVMDIARASGAAIGVVDGKSVRYQAAAGSKALPIGTEVFTEKALCLPCIRNGQAFRCADIDPEFLIDTSECRRRGIQAIIAVPIFHEGAVAAGLEVYYPNQHGFTDQDVHTCQLMAGLVTEAMARNEEQSWKQSLASERAMMLEALEKLKPNLSALVAPGTPEASVAPKIPSATTNAHICIHCGNKFVAQEKFCGQCGTPRRGVEVPAAPLQATFAAANQIPPVPMPPGALSAEESLADSVEEQFPELFAPYESSAAKKTDTAEHTAVTPMAEEHSLAAELEAPLHPEQLGTIQNQQEDEPANEPAEAALVPLPPAANWTSAASAREFLEQVAKGQRRGALARFWDARRGDIYLAIAVILVACVIRWGIWSNHPVSATSTGTAAHHATAPDADLSLFERMLISMGLAEAPAPPEDKGNPSVQVWIDLHTALYYCPGSDLYGKTKTGKYEAQRDAQLDQYEPAYREPCK